MSSQSSPLWIEFDVVNPCGVQSLPSPHLGNLSSRVSSWKRIWIISFTHTNLLQLSQLDFSHHLSELYGHSNRQGWCDATKTREKGRKRGFSLRIKLWACGRSRHMTTHYRVYKNSVRSSQATRSSTARQTLHELLRRVFLDAFLLFVQRSIGPALKLLHRNSYGIRFITQNRCEFS
jgi:hypothetical protein